jgi:hypothetical protein
MNLFVLIPLYFITWVSLISLMLTLFRFRIQHYWQQIIFCSLITTQASCMIKIFELDFLMAIIQPLFIWIGFTLIIRIHWLHSMLMVLSGYVIDVLLEVLINMLLSGFNYNEFIQIMKEQFYWQDSIVILCNLFFVILLIKHRLGFTFISAHKKSVQLPFSRTMRIALLLGILSITISSIDLYMWGEWVIVTYGSIFLISAVFLHLFYTRETSEP